MEDLKNKKKELFSKYTTEELSRLLMTLCVNNSGGQSPSTKAVLEELEKREKESSESKSKDEKPKKKLL